MSGFDDLNRISADLTMAAEKAQRMAPAIVAKAAQDVEAIAKSFCPVDTGYLRSSIHTVLDPSSVRATIGPSAEYAPFVEWGTHRQAPQAFMGPALDRVSPGFVKAIEQLGGEIL